MELDEEEFEVQTKISAMTNELHRAEVRKRKLAKENKNLIEYGLQF